MNLRYQISLTVIVFALVGYLFHNFKTKSEAFIHHQDIVYSKINELNRIEMQINKEILQGGFYLYFSYDKLNSDIDRFFVTIDALLQDPELHSTTYRSFFDLLTQYKSYFIQKEEGIREYQTLNSGIKNALTYLSVLIEEIDKTSTLEPQNSYRYQKSSASLLSAIFRAKNSMDSDLLENSKVLIGKLSKYRFRDLSSEDIHERLMKNANYFILNFRHYVEKVDTVLKETRPSFMVTLSRSFHLANHAKEDRINRLLYLLIFLFVLTTMLIIFFLYSWDRKNKELVALEKINLQKEHMLFQKSRQAQMGEMLSMISHQWRQPLTAISMTTGYIESKFSLHSYDFGETKDQEKCLTFVQENIAKINSFVHHLSHTIDDFRNFYKPNKQKNDVAITVPFENALKIIQSTLDANKIKVIVDLAGQRRLPLHESELMQVFLNLFKNAEDNFKEKGTIEPVISVRSEDIENGVRITLGDNGGGIPAEIQDVIFDPYFSTKDEKNGTGLGLYMSKIIVEEHHKGKLLVRNSDQGAEFVIEIYPN